MSGWDFEVDFKVAIGSLFGSYDGSYEPIPCVRALWFF